MTAPLMHSLAFKLCLYFTLAPDEYLTRDDIATRYDVKAGNVKTMLRHALSAGWLARDVEGAGHAAVTTYRAGPLLLAEIERFRLPV